MLGAGSNLKGPEGTVRVCEVQYEDSRLWPGWRGRSSGVWLFLSRACMEEGREYNQVRKVYKGRMEDVVFSGR